MKVDITRSNILSGAEYKKADKQLIITFIKGGQYLYEDVPENVFNDLISAESAGKYFLAHIKDKFKTEKL